MKIQAHTSFIGTTGYANHAQSFFTELDKLTPIKVRNATVGKSWNWPNNTPHDKESYITPQMKKMLHLQTLFEADKISPANLLDIELPDLFLALSIIH